MLNFLIVYLAIGLFFMSYVAATIDEKKLNKNVDEIIKIGIIKSRLLVIAIWFVVAVLIWPVPILKGLFNV